MQTAMTANATASKAVKRHMLGLELHGWENLMVISLVVAGAFALIVGVATYCVVQLQREEISRSKDEFDRYKVEASKEVAGARADADAKIGVAREEAAAQIATAREEAGAKVEEARAEAATAAENSRVEIARAQEAIAGFNARTEEARAEAAKAHLALVEYRKSRSDRIVEHADSVGEILKAFAGARFDFGHGPEGFREQWDFAWRFEPILVKAGWEFVDWDGPNVIGKLNDWFPRARLYGLTNVVNVSIEMHPGTEEALFPAAKALAAALNEAGIAATAGGNNNTSANAGVIHVLIGEKQ